MTQLTSSYWPATADIALIDSTCGSALRAAAVADPDKLALIDGHADRARRRRWTYAELLAEAERTARALLDCFQPGEHVAIWAGNCPQWVILQYAIALAGLVMVTVNPACRSAELTYVLRQSRARGVFHQTDYRGLDMGATVRAAVASEAHAVATVVCLDALAEFVAMHDRGAALPAVAPADPCMIQYTSGTTGRPKGGAAQSLQRHQQRAHHGVDQRSRCGCDQSCRGAVVPHGRLCRQRARHDPDRRHHGTASEF